jgi:hypothetical protein
VGKRGKNTFLIFFSLTGGTIAALEKVNSAKLFNPLLPLEIDSLSLFPNSWKNR